MSTENRISKRSRRSCPANSGRFHPAGTERPGLTEARWFRGRCPDPTRSRSGSSRSVRRYPGAGILASSGSAEPEPADAGHLEPTCGKRRVGRWRLGWEMAALAGPIAQLAQLGQRRWGKRGWNTELAQLLAQLVAADPHERAAVPGAEHPHRRSPTDALLQYRLPLLLPPSA